MTHARHRPSSASTASAIIMLLLALSCSDSTAPPDDSGAPGLSIIAGASATDTIEAVLPQALVIEVRDQQGRALQGVEVIYTSDVGPAYVLAAQLDRRDFRYWTSDTTDEHGRSAVVVQLGPTAGEAPIDIRVAALGASVTATFTVRPGAAASVDVQPSDTVLYVGGTASLRGTVLDRMRNARSDAVTFSTLSAEQSVSVADGVAHGERIGRGRIVASAGAFTDTGFVSVVPTGEIVAYERPIFYESNGGRVVGRPARIMRMGLDGSRLRTLIEQNPPDDPRGWGDGMNPRWSPTGSDIVYLSGRGVWITDTSGTARHVIAPPPEVRFDFSPEFSSDRQWIYFTVAGDSGTRVHRVHPDGSGLERILASGLDARAASPSPTDGRFVYQSVGFPVGNIRMLDPTTNTVTELGVRGQIPRWSPTGEWIAYLDENAMLRLVRPDGSGARLLGNGIVAHSSFTWSPDGAWLLITILEYTPNEGVRASLALVAVPSGEMLPIHLERELVQPSWRR